MGIDYLWMGLISLVSQGALLQLESLSAAVALELMTVSAFIPIGPIALIIKTSSL